MRIPLTLLTILAALLSSCGDEPKPSASVAVKKAETPKPADESRRFPKANLVEAKVVDKELLGKPFMPGGTLARYRKGKTEYEMFVARLPSALDAALLLPDWDKSLAGSKLIPSFGGYFGPGRGPACIRIFQGRMDRRNRGPTRKRRGCAGPYAGRTAQLKPA